MSLGIKNEKHGRAPRILLYSHDTFGLGHLRRSRALAGAITQANPQTSALILTGSPLAGRFTFPRRVDHVRLPGVTKLADGSYASQSIGMGINEVTELRSSLIQTAVKQFDPDVLIVDKEPTGFRGELLPTLGAPGTYSHHQTGSWPARRPGRARSSGRRMAPQGRNHCDWTILR